MGIIKSQISGLFGQILPLRDVFDFEVKKRQVLLLTELLGGAEMFGRLDL